MTGSLGARLAQGEILHLRADVTHHRRGKTRHRFAYRVDYLLLSPEHVTRGRGLFGRNRFNLFSLHDRDHGGARGAGRGADWAWQHFTALGLSPTPARTLALLTQPRFLGYGFNPVSFWCLFEGESLRAVIAEVNNTFGDRHSYLCHSPDGPLIPARTVEAQKILHVSPFQDVAGHYRFRFALTPAQVAIHIAYENGPEGLAATLAARPAPLSQTGLLAAACARPGGALRVMALIYWQALQLWRRKIAYRPRPAAPEKDISL